MKNEKLNFKNEFQDNVSDLLMIYLGVLGLVKGYIAEKQTADEHIRSLENRNEALIKETERLRVRLRVLEDNHESVFQREQDLVHQQQTLELSVDESRKSMQCYRCAVSSCYIIINVRVVVIVVHITA